MKTRYFAFVFVGIAALLFTLYSALARPASAAQIGQQWEYAQMYAGASEGVQRFAVLVADKEEKQRLDADLAQFGAPVGQVNLDPSGTATPMALPDITALGKALDYMGGQGWELVTIQSDGVSAVSVYTFKRPV